VKQLKNISRNLQIESRTDVLADVRKFVSTAARDFGFNDDDVMKIEIAVDEACTNIIKHAYANRPDGWIKIEIDGKSGKSQDKFIISITDAGKAFDSSKYVAPDMKEYFKNLRRGGLGVFLMKKIMDEVEYGNNNSAENSLRLVKYRARAV